MSDLSRRKLFGFIAAMPLALHPAAAAPIVAVQDDFTTDDLLIKCTYRLLPTQYGVTREILEDGLYAQVKRTVEASYGTHGL